MEKQKKVEKLCVPNPIWKNVIPRKGYAHMIMVMLYGTETKKGAPLTSLKTVVDKTDGWQKIRYMGEKQNRKIAENT